MLFKVGENMDESLLHIKHRQFVAIGDFSSQLAFSGHLWVWISGLRDGGTF